MARLRFFLIVAFGFPLVAIAGLACVTTEAREAKPTLIAPISERQELEAFWSSFRSAALSEDWHRIEKMTRFPLEARGLLDASQVHYYSPSDLPQLFNHIMEEDSGLTIRETQTNRMLMQSVASLKYSRRGVVVTDDSARVGPFLFIWGADGWQLARVYVNED